MSSLTTSSLSMSPLLSPPDLTVAVPGSKSHTNRALICAALANGTSRLNGILLAEDTWAMLNALKELGIELVVDEANHQVEIQGCAGKLPPHARRVTDDQENLKLNVRQSGTTGRFLLPMLTLGSGRFTLDGDAQLRARPFGELVSGLRSLGARIEGESLPLVVEGAGLRGATIQISGSVSSQFLSALLLSAPCAESEVVIEVTSPLVSKPYIDLTLATMESFGARVINDEYQRFVIENCGYGATNLAIEPDASAASYFFAAAAMTGGRITVEGLGTETIQGDLKFVKALEAMGATAFQDSNRTTVSAPIDTGLVGIEIDMADISDTAQTLAVVAPFAATPTRITGIGFIRKKETDRIGAVVQELSRLGVRAIEEDDGLVIYPGLPGPGLVHTYHDHRMAMSFALLGLVVSGIRIDNPGCVAKTFPTFFEVLHQLQTDQGAS